MATRLIKKKIVIWKYPYSSSYFCFSPTGSSDSGLTLTCLIHHDVTPSSILTEPSGRDVPGFKLEQLSIYHMATPLVDSVGVAKPVFIGSPSLAPTFHQNPWGHHLGRPFPSPFQGSRRGPVWRNKERERNPPDGGHAVRTGPDQQ